MTLLTALAGFVGVTYVADVVIRPADVAARARAFARRRGKPVINVGAGTPGSSVRAAVLGPTLWGDVNVDIAAPRRRPGPHVVTFGDAHCLPYKDKTFGALIASHVLEHMDDPQRAYREFCRVADRVFIITPRWWAPHTWLHPGHQWVIDDQTLTVSPLHRHRQNARFLRTGQGLF